MFDAAEAAPPSDARPPSEAADLGGDAGMPLGPTPGSDGGGLADLAPLPTPGDSLGYVNESAALAYLCVAKKNTYKTLLPWDIPV